MAGFQEEAACRLHLPRPRRPYGGAQEADSHPGDGDSASQAAATLGAAYAGVRGGVSDGAVFADAAPFGALPGFGVWPLVQCKTTGLRVLYTGDFRVKPNPTAEPLATVPCDVLIMESTYGREDYVFPSQDEVLKDFFDSVFDWTDAGGVPVVLAYRMGKTQELLHHLLTRGYRVAVGGRRIRNYPQFRGGGGAVSPFRRLTASSTARCGTERRWYFRLADGRGRRCPASGTKRYFGMSGWALNQERAHWTGADVSFPFSDHADYEELLAYVEAVGAKEVYTVFGFPDLARDLQGRGYKAAHLEKGTSSVQLKFA